MNVNVLQKRNIQIAILTVVVSTIIILTLSSIQQTDPPVDEELVMQGVAVYTSNYCGACHQLDLAETNGQFGPPHNDAGLIAKQRVQDDSYYGNAQTAEEFLIESIVDPQAYLHPDYIASSHAMPAFSSLSEPDLNAVVYMLMQQQNTE